MLKQLSRAATRQRGVARIASLILAAGLAACSGGDEVARVDVQPHMDLPDSVPLGEPLNMGYRWTPSADFTPPAEDYQVFVHLSDPQGNIVLQDDHYPPEPTSQWRPGQELTYRRWLYPPEDLEVEYLDIVMGLYSRDGRAEVRMGGEWSEAPPVHRLAIRADDMSGIPVYMDGWYPIEQVTEPEERSWRWSKDEAHAVFTNPGKDAVLHLRAHSPYDELGGPQAIVLRIGEQEIARLQVGNADTFMERIQIPASAMGDNEWVELTLEAAPALVPRQLDPESQDDRTLGVQVFHMYLSSS